MGIGQVCEGCRGFGQRRSLKQALYETLAEDGQKPEVMWIGCSDSRVVPELIAGVDPGELFVLRNVANIVPAYDERDAGVGAAIEYAVDHLSVTDIVICGHTDCGGVKALAAETELPEDSLIRRWIEHERELLGEALAEGDTLLARVRANVRVQCRHVMTYPCVAEAVATGGLTVHGWQYDLAAGSMWALGEGDAWECLGR